MKQVFYIFSILVLTVLSVSCQDRVVTEVIHPDNESLIRNPAMGWGIYADNKVMDADVFWEDLGEPASEYCTFLYIRVPWSYMEPREGYYAWEYDDNYKALVKEARKRGLRLCFRVFYDSQDMSFQSTPEYVRAAGASGYVSNTGYWSPYPDDPVFQDKLEKFVGAFAEEYDDPSFVDCIDAYNLGWWGEGHHVRLMNPDNFKETSLRISGIYSEAFENVLLAINYHREITEDVLAEIIERYDFILRHDAFGSQWYGDFERNFAAAYGFPDRPVLAESCYWFVGIDKGTRINPDGTDDTERWRNDEYRRGMDSWRDVYLATYEDAEEAHANTLDLREKREAASWIAEAPDVVEKFMLNGGYRFTPVKVSYHATVNRKDTVTVEHTWINSGFGKFPGDNRRWEGRYMPAFSLIGASDSSKEYIVAVDSLARPSDWFKGSEYTCRTVLDLSDVPAGKYILAVSILDTDRMIPGITLSVSDRVSVNGWILLGDINVK